MKRKGMKGGHRNTGPSIEVREGVLWRDEGRCQWCGKYMRDMDTGYSLQHRRARGMGGTSDEAANYYSNLILMCGSGTTGCHGWVESHPAAAAARGFRVPQGIDPAGAPYMDWMGRAWFLDNDGHKRQL